jgi:hypothetical protein
MGTEEKKGKGNAFRPRLRPRPGPSTKISASSPPPHASHVDVPATPLTPREDCLLAACTFIKCKRAVKDIKDFLAKIEQRVKQPTYSHLLHEGRGAQETVRQVRRSIQPGQPQRRIGN